MTSTIDGANALDAATYLDKAADEIERRGLLHGWYCDPRVAYDNTLDDAIRGVLEANRDSDIITALLREYERNDDYADPTDPLVDLNYSNWSRATLKPPEVTEETCRVCSLGALNWVIEGRLTLGIGNDWLYDYTENRPTPLAVTMMTAFNEVTGQEFGNMVARWSSAGISNYNDTHSQAEVVAALRKAAAHLRT